MKTDKLSLIVAIGITLSACQSKPKTIEAVPLSGSEALASYQSPMQESNHDESSRQEHRVEVLEVLNTDKYSYLNVKEEDQQFWIAIPRKEVTVGDSYFYKGGLLKKHFHSKEYNRVFETVYLVSDVLPIMDDGSVDYHASIPADPRKEQPVEVASTHDAIKISEIVADPQKYQGKLTKITGKCVKVNPMIMNRNWVHIQDGSGDNYDLTVTTQEEILMGTVVSLEGVIALQKDFGAGYRYDIIMEDAVLK